MSSFFFWRIFSACLCTAVSLVSLEISPEEADLIGKRIYQNECSSKSERLVWWNDGENFASLGIGHFIWYPADKKGPFEETFPTLLAFFKESDVQMPDWLNDASHCIWNSREEFISQTQNSKKKQLQKVLEESISLQTIFIANRFEQVVPELLIDLNEQQKTHVSKQLSRLGRSLQGKYALLDYLNFKGKGLLETERYKDEGWGLKQVLLKMPDSDKDPLIAFVESAKSLLKQRVSNAPVERTEDRWLQGWLARVDSYNSFVR